MLDVRLIRAEPDAVERALADKGGAELVRRVLAIDERRRALVREADDLKAQRNRASEAIAQAKRRGEDAAAEVARQREVGDRIKVLDGELRTIDDELEALGLLDMPRAARMAKARFSLLWGPLARLSRALAQFMLDLHTREHGYTEFWLPQLVNGDTMLRSGQLPKFEEQLFKTVEADEGRTLYLIPTAEVSLTALHFDETLPEASLPRRYTAYTPCYRREAGTYGKDMKGIYRQHQFDKVELVKIATPEQADAELESLVENAETVLRRLDLPYRVAERCVGDLGFSATKGYDIEVWRPALAKYTEISSCSSYGAFGGRRAAIRYRPAGGGRSEFCATLNGSGLSVGRTIIAVLENYQEADGTVTVPPALRPYMDGLERLTARR